MKIFLIIYLAFCLLATASAQEKNSENNPFIVVLGIAQDAGYPQAGCAKECCNRGWQDPRLKKFVSSLALVDPSAKKWWLFDATPDLKEQLQLFQEITNRAYAYLPDGIFLTHGHIGHYTGLMELGREAMNTKSIPVYVLPGMENYLTNNGPWSLLVQLKNVSLQVMQAGNPVSLSTQLSVIPFLVPHRDEFTETAGYKIQWENKNALFIPDIDKWEKFDQKIYDLVQQSSMAFLDATFYNEGELKGRSISEIPHPLVAESMALFRFLSAADKMKIYFIHFNHTNPLLNSNSAEFMYVKKMYMIAEQGAVVKFPQ